MVIVTFRSLGGGDFAMDVNSDVLLRDLQEPLCRAFRQSFPSKKASLTIDGNAFCELNEKPFIDKESDINCNVTFAATDDPFFYDRADRGLKITLEEEVAHDQAVSDGSNDDLKAWVLKQRFPPFDDMM